MCRTLTTLFPSATFEVESPQKLGVQGDDDRGKAHQQRPHCRGERDADGSSDPGRERDPEHVVTAVTGRLRASWMRLRDGELSHAHELCRHVPGVADGELSPRSLGLAAAPGEPGNGLEVRIEHDHALLARSLGDEGVQRPLGRHELAARPPVAVVHDDEWDPDGLADPREEGDVRLASALDDRYRLPVDVVSERREHEGQNELLGQPLDEYDGAGEEELAARGVELGHDAEVLVGGHRVGLQGARAGARTPLDEHELVHPGHVEEGG